MLNQSIVSAIHCIRLLASSNVPLGVREMGRILSLDAARVSRIMKTLDSLNLVHKDEKRKYSVGWGMHELSALSIHNSQFIRSVVSALEDIDFQKITVAIGILSGKDVVYLVHTGKVKTAIDSIGNHDTIPAISSVVGVKLLSLRTDEEIIELIGTNDFVLMRKDIYDARLEKVFTKEYPYNEYRFAQQLSNGAAVIAISNIYCSKYELHKYQSLLEQLSMKISAYRSDT